MQPDRTVTPLSLWLASTSITDDPAGDLIADFRCDLHRPPHFSSIHEMHDYLIGHNACIGALLAVPEVWQRYKRWHDGRPSFRSRGEQIAIAKTEVGHS